MSAQLGTRQALSSTRWGLVLPLAPAYSFSRSHWLSSLEHLRDRRIHDRHTQQDRAIIIGGHRSDALLIYGGDDRLFPSVVISLVNDMFTK